MPWIQCLRSLPDQPGRSRRGPSLTTAGPPRKRPLMCLSPPRGRREKCVFGSSLARYGTQVCDCCGSRQNKTQTFSKIEQASFSASHKRPALMQPVCTMVLTPCHAGRDLAGHPRCVSLGNEHGKMRLFTPIHSKTTALPRCARHLSAQRRGSCSPHRGGESAGKRSHRNRSSSPERVRVFKAATSSSPKKTAACDLF